MLDKLICFNTSYSTLMNFHFLSFAPRKSLEGFLRRMHNDDGSFSMHDGGESDTRSIYCAASVAKLTGLVDSTKSLFTNSCDWLARLVAVAGSLYRLCVCFYFCLCQSAHFTYFLLFDCSKF